MFCKEEAATAAILNMGEAIRTRTCVQSRQITQIFVLRIASATDPVTYLQGQEQR